MLPIRRSVVGIVSQLPRQQSCVISATSQFIRYNSSSSSSDSSKPSEQKQNKKTAQADVSQIPLAYVGCMSDYYVPPKFKNCPVKSWPKLLLRRFMLFALNTYNIIKFKREMGTPLEFNMWKDRGIENFVRANKLFANACNSTSFRDKQEYLVRKLDPNCGNHVIESLLKRSLTFPKDSKLSWQLVSITKDPKIIGFNVIPDRHGIACFVQLVMKLDSVQKVTITNKAGDKVLQEKESPMEDYLVYSLNPVKQEILLVGKLFESNHIRGLKPEIDTFDQKIVGQFLKTSSDIYRADPKQVEKENQEIAEKKNQEIKEEVKRVNAKKMKQK